MTSKIFILPLVLLLILFAVLRVDAQRQLQVQEDRDAIEKANSLYYSRQYLEAIEAYQSLLKTTLSKETGNEIRMNLGQCYAKRGDDALAIRTFQEIIEADPDGSYATQATHKIGNLYTRRYQYKEAIRACKTLAETYPKTRTAALAESDGSLAGLRDAALLRLGSDALLRVISRQRIAPVNGQTDDAAQDGNDIRQNGEDPLGGFDFTVGRGFRGRALLH